MLSKSLSFRAFFGRPLFPIKKTMRPKKATPNTMTPMLYCCEPESPLLGEGEVEEEGFLLNLRSICVVEIVGSAASPTSSLSRPWLEKPRTMPVE